MTNAELAILSLIGEQPRHGYEIEQVIEERGMREWTEVGFSSIYYLLKKLERDALVESALEEAERGPARKVYTLTPAGQEALQAGLIEALSTPHHCYPPIQLGLSNLPAIPQAQVQPALQQYRATLEGRRAAVEAKWNAQRPLPPFVDAVFDYSLTMIQAELAWVERLIDQLSVSRDS